MIEGPASAHGDYHSEVISDSLTSQARAKSKSGVVIHLRQPRQANNLVKVVSVTSEEHLREVVCVVLPSPETKPGRRSTEEP